MISKKINIFQTKIYGYSLRLGEINLSSDGKLVLDKYFYWNGATLIKTTRKNYYASMEHDAIYDLIIAGLLPKSCRKVAVQKYYDSCISHGTNIVWAKVQYWGIRIGGGWFI